jgi:hypothetical protein
MAASANFAILSTENPQKLLSYYYSRSDENGKNKNIFGFEPNREYT